MQYDLSILIPARNEMFLSRTVEDILKNRRGNTEVIVGLDGQWSNPPIGDFDDVTIFYSPVSLGQREMTNQLCRLSKSKYVMKLDSHCALDEGFDVKMMDKMKDNYTLVPLMRNLHAFDWVCPEGHRRYQGPSGVCKECGKETTKDILWIGKDSPKSTAFRFDKTLHFQYWNDFKKRPEGQGELTDTLTIQGSCFMLTRDKYWELNICDPEFGSWGQQGVEVALKTWLSGGRVVCNQTTWYAHMFRTQGGDFGFPYPISGRQTDHAREFSRELFIKDKWSQAIMTFNDVLQKFYPVPEWHDDTPAVVKPKKEVVYYTHGVGDNQLLEACRRQLAKGMKTKHIVSISTNSLDFGKNIVFPRLEVGGFLDMFQRILLGLEATTADIIFFCEHDVLYHPSHFDFIPPSKDMYYYNTNVWRVRASDGHSLYTDNLQQLSGLCAYRETLLTHYRKRLKMIYEKGFSNAQGFEPGTHGREERVDDLKAESYFSAFPNLDIRHETNATASRWTKEEFRNKRYTEGWTEKKISEIPGWNTTDLASLLANI
jgi:hypothetical protein